MRWLLCLFALPACVGYQPKSFRTTTGELPPARASLDCVDVAIAASPQPVARPVLEVVIANGCDRALVVDLAAVRLQMDGQSLAPYDPRDELHPATLEARRAVRLIVSFGEDELADYDSTAQPPMCLAVGALLPARSHPRTGICIGEPAIAEVVQ